MEYTKGEWRAKKDPENNSWFIVDANNFILAVVHGESNAHLISATPDLYEASKELLNYIDGIGGANKQWRTEFADHLINGVHKALTKAEGK